MAQKIFLLLICFVLTGSAGVRIMAGVSDMSTPQAPTQLKCEYLADPLGIDVAQPRFFWVAEHDRRNEIQSACQVIVSSDPKGEKGDLWDSGRVPSTHSGQFVYHGQALESNRTYYWKVRYWDKEGSSSPYSRTARFDTALLQPSDWKGDWIGGKSQMRKEFTLNGKIARGRVFICGLGYSELRLNGRKVGSSVLDPGWTIYDKRVLYATHDVTGMLHPGANAIGVMLGNGWFKAKALKLEMRIALEDGSEVRLGSDLTWKGTEGPVLSDSVYNGETYDARLETPGWDKAGFDDGNWAPVDKLTGPAGVLSAQMMPPIRVIDTIVPLKMTCPNPGVFVFDMGQNFSGWACLRVQGPAGTHVRMRFAEMLYENGMLNVENLRNARAEDIYILRGEGEEVYEPRFTYHGYRYVELAGFPGTPTVESIRGRVVHSAVQPVGNFACSKPVLNQVQRLVTWGQKTNLHSIPTDCDQRNERLGWMGDAHATAEEAIFNFDMAAFYTNFIRNIRDVQEKDGSITDTVPHIWGLRPADPAWGTAYPSLCWRMYQYYGDRRILEEQYEGLKRYVEFLRSRAENGLVTYSSYGDWVAIDKTPGSLISSFYYYHDVKILADISGIIGRKADSAHYADLAKTINAEFQKRYFDAKTGNYANGTQTANALPLFLDMVPEKLRATVLQNLFENIVYRYNSHISSGFIGTMYILDLLTRSGNADLAYDMASQTTYPSWGYMIENGATTLWELWQLRTGPSMNSHNHPMFGSVGAWFYKALAGINLEDGSVAFERIRIRPQMVRDLWHASASLRTLNGTVSNSWSRTEKSIRLEATIPVNSQAVIVLPKFNLDHILIREGDRTVWAEKKYEAGIPGISTVEDTASGIEIHVGSGTYTFVLTGE